MTVVQARARGQTQDSFRPCPAMTSQTIEENSFSCMKPITVRQRCHRASQGPSKHTEHHDPTPNKSQVIVEAAGGFESARTKAQCTEARPIRKASNRCRSQDESQTLKHRRHSRTKPPSRHIQAKVFLTCCSAAEDGKATNLLYTSNDLNDREVKQRRLVES